MNKVSETSAGSKSNGKMERRTKGVESNRGSRTQGNEGKENQIKKERENLQIYSRIMHLILGGLKVRTSPFSCFPSAIPLAEELKFGTLHSTSFFILKLI